MQRQRWQVVHVSIEMSLLQHYLSMLSNRPGQMLQVRPQASTLPRSWVSTAKSEPMVNITMPPAALCA